MKYQKRIHWDRHRPEFLKLGFIFALAFVLMAFNYTSKPPVITPFEVAPLEIDILQIPPVTVQQKTVLPPPPPEKITVVTIEPTAEPIVKFTEEVFDEAPVENMEVVNTFDPIIETVPKVEIVRKKAPIEEGPLLFAERMPVYGNCGEVLNEGDRIKCTHKTIVEHTYAYVRYPAMARQNNIEGTVVVSFVVNKKGKIEDVEIMRDIGMGCGAEVMKAIKKLDAFSPGKQNGRPVAVRFRFPVKFSLQ